MGFDVDNFDGKTPKLKRPLIIFDLKENIQYKIISVGSGLSIGDEPPQIGESISFEYDFKKTRAVLLVGNI